jgi:hypothetical protein
MGQSSIPILNRVGYSMFWTSVWDNKHNYTSLFKEDILIRKYINLLFNEKISTQIFSYKNIKTDTLILNNFQKSYNIKFFLNKQSVIGLLQRFNKLPLYISKIHIIRLNNWIILYFISSTPTNLKKFDISSNTKSYFYTPFFLKKHLLNNFKKNLFF